jgi:hypothetical protein
LPHVCAGSPGHVFFCHGSHFPRVALGGRVVVLLWRQPGRAGDRLDADGRRLVTASAIAALAFGLPGFLAYVLAHWLDTTAERLEKTQPLPMIRAADVAAAAQRIVNPFRAPFQGYAIAVAAVLLAWGVRAALDSVIPQQTPFITFFLAVALAGWLGGFGPAALATFLSLLIAWVFFLAAAARSAAGGRGSTPGGDAARKSGAVAGHGRHRAGPDLDVGYDEGLRLLQRNVVAVHGPHAGAGVGQRVGRRRASG